LNKADQQQAQNTEEDKKEDDSKGDDRSMFQRFMGLGKKEEEEEGKEIKVQEPMSDEEPQSRLAGFGMQRKLREDPFRPKN